MKRLIAERSATLSVERAKRNLKPGETLVGGVAMQFFDGSAAKDVHDAAKWVQAAIAVCRTAPDARDVFGDDLSDEAIAGHLLERLRKKNATLR
jgi:hypothetical protein